MAKREKLTYCAVQVSGENTRYRFYKLKTAISTRRLVDKLFRKDPTVDIDITRHHHWFGHDDRGEPKLIRTMEIKFPIVRIKKGKPKIVRRFPKSSKF